MSIFEFSLLLIVGLGALATAVYRITSIAEDGISSEGKKKLQNIVKNYRATPTFRHSFLTFTMASDVFFGERIISLKAFIRSAILSIAWMFVISALCITLFPKYKSWFFDDGIAGVILEYGLVLVGAVIVLDYLSVSITRLIVKKSLPNSIISLGFTFTIDLLASILIFYFGFSVVKYIFVHPSWVGFNEAISIWINIDQLPILLKTLTDLSGDMLQKQTDGSFSINGGWKTEVMYAFPEGVTFYSSLLTSIWLWLHTISYVLFKWSLSFDKTKSRILLMTNIENKPFRSLGLITLIAYLALIPLLIIGYMIITYWM